MPTVLCRLPNHVGDCCMCLPALRLLAASGFTPALVGKRWAEDLMAGMGWRFDPIEGKVTEDLSCTECKYFRGIVVPKLFRISPTLQIGAAQDYGTEDRYALFYPGQWHS